MIEQLRRLLYKDFQIEIDTDSLTVLSAMLINSPKRNKLLVLNLRTSVNEQTYLGVHAAAHVLLGHFRSPFQTIFEPIPGFSFRFINDEEKEHFQAKVLTDAIFKKGVVHNNWEEIWQSINEFGLPDFVMEEDIRSKAFKFSLIL